MSWLNYVSQGSNQHEPTDNQGLADILCSSPSALFTCPIEGPASTAKHGSAGFSSPSSSDFPPAPQGLVSPPSLEKLSCACPSAGPVREPEPISYVTLQEQRCVLSWFQGWTAAQRERFLQDLLGKAVPGKVCTLLDSLSTLQVKDKLPNIFECQLRLWTQWFESWGEEDRNHFLHMLEERDPEFVSHFYRSVAGTAGRD